MGGGGVKLDQGGQIGSNVGGGANWPKVVFIFIVQGEKGEGRQMILCPPLLKGGGDGPVAPPFPTPL